MKQLNVTSYVEVRGTKYFTLTVDDVEVEVIEWAYWQDEVAARVEVFQLDGTPTQLDDHTMREIRHLVEDYPPVLDVMRDALNMISLEKQAITGANAVYQLHRQVTG